VDLSKGRLLIATDCCKCVEVSAAEGRLIRGSLNLWGLLKPCLFKQIKKSSFVVTAWPLTGTGKQALELIRSVSDPDATHNCWGELIAAYFLSCLHKLLFMGLHVGECVWASRIQNDIPPVLIDYFVSCICALIKQRKPCKDQHLHLHVQHTAVAKSTAALMMESRGERQEGRS